MGEQGPSQPERYDWATVLIVDDDEQSRDLLGRGIAHFGIQVREAADGEAALRILHTWDVDLVLLDVMMPDFDGFEILRMMQEDARLREVPVVLISALDDTDSIVRGIELGAEDYLPKPCHQVLLRARVGASLQKKRFRDAERARQYQGTVLAAAVASWSQEIAQGSNPAPDPPTAPREPSTDAVVSPGGAAAWPSPGDPRATLAVERLRATVRAIAQFTNHMDRELPTLSPLRVYLEEIKKANREAATVLDRLAGS